MLSSLCFRTATVAVMVAAILGMPNQVSAQRDQSGAGVAGNYLAARHADARRDAASAAAYFRSALRIEPNNPELLDRAFYAALANGEIDEAAKLGKRLLRIERTARNPNAHLVLGVKALKRQRYRTARSRLKQAARGPVADLLATLLAGWALAGSKNSKSATAQIDRLSGPDWYGVFKDFHAGLILDLAGRRKAAGKRLERAYSVDSSALRVVQAYGGWLSRNGRRDEALEVFEKFDATLPRHPLVRDAIATLKKGRPLPRFVKSATAGAAEALYGLGTALARREKQLSLSNRGLAYLQLALYLQPDHALALLSLADLYEAMKKPQLAIDVYSRVPKDSLVRLNAERQTTLNLDSLGRTDEARQKLEKLIAKHPDDLDVVLALGNVLRERKLFSECSETYSKAIDLIAEPTKANWTTYYFRGICYERSKQWNRAEADLEKALELYPGQPHILNYLGYSWIDHGVNIDEGMRMIELAVEQRPDDGYIVDSLGWAYYRLGNYDEAVKHLERAAELKPMDSTINDHLGDVYWKVGRRLEAKYRWTRARDLKPEPEELAKIEAKLKQGLPNAPAASAGTDEHKSTGTDK